MTPKKRGTAVAANEESSQPTKKRSPVKKAVAATNGEVTEPATPTPKTSPKKRASPKKKQTADAIVKTENGETDGETEGLEPVTPKKGKRAPAKGKGEGKDSKTNGGGGSSENSSSTKSNGNGNAEMIDGMTVHNTPRKRQAPKKELAAPRGIPTSWDDADHADRMLVTMKNKGDGWAEIRAAWKAVTGQETASRYALSSMRKNISTKCRRCRLTYIYN